MHWAKHIDLVLPDGRKTEAKFWFPDPDKNTVVKSDTKLCIFQKNWRDLGADFGMELPI